MGLLSRRMIRAETFVWLRDRRGDMATTRLGRWAIWLFVASFILLAMLIVAYNTDALWPLDADPLALLLAEI